MPPRAREHAIVGRYRLAEFLGAGGMGEVYRATHLETHQVVAVKIFSPAAIEAKWLARFYHEARVHGRLDHPNIVRLIELVDAGGRPALVMEYVDGESLADRISRQGRVPPRTAARWIRDVASALAHVHALGIVHRDIKPANVRLTQAQQVKLLDFGIAKSAQAPELTNTGHVIGTLRYLSPEQLNGQPVTPATDIWALGVMLYELLTAQVPFEAATTAEMWGRITSGTYQPVSRLLTVAEDERALLGALDDVIAGCLARKPERRHASATALAARLDRLVAPPAPGPDLLTRLHGATALALEHVEHHVRSYAVAAGLLVLVVFAVALWPEIGPGPQPSPGPSPAAAATVRHHIDVMTGRAQVRVNGRAIGSTPVDYHGQPGETIEIELQQDGYAPVRERVFLTKDGTSTFAMRSLGTLP
jgi:serine/threonine-protein kinase